MAEFFAFKTKWLIATIIMLLVVTMVGCVDSTNDSEYTTTEAVTEAPAESTEVTTEVPAEEATTPEVLVILSEIPEVANTVHEALEGAEG